MIELPSRNSKSVTSRPRFPQPLAAFTVDLVRGERGTGAGGGLGSTLQTGIQTTSPIFWETSPPLRAGCGLRVVAIMRGERHATLVRDEATLPKSFRTVHSRLPSRLNV